MYSDPKKLRSNIYKDFKDQDSWQCYSTLLFADVSTSDLIQQSTTKKTKTLN